MIIQNFNPFSGEHCETTATGSLLKHIGIELSEAMLFGLGEGIGFILWKMKIMDFPFIGGRIKPDFITRNLVRNLSLEMQVLETSSVARARDTVRQYIDNNIPVGLKLDCYHLEYFTQKFHFAAHYVAMYGYDETHAWLVDTKQQGSNLKTSLESLELARNEKGNMSSRNLSYVISRGQTKVNMRQTLMQAVRRNAYEYLNPPISNFGYRGIEKLGNSLISWYENSRDIAGDFKTSALLMEKAGTGGALFRNLYRDFLKECCEWISKEETKKSYAMFCDIAKLWNEVSGLFEKTGNTEDIRYIKECRAILKELSVKEKNAMELLARI